MNAKISILATKLHPARPQPETIVRERLALSRDELLRRRLILLSAPAGFGKTTLVGSWVESLALPTAWISLDRGDNEPVRFLTYLHAALAGVAVEFGSSLAEGLRMSPLPDLETLMTALVNDLANASSDFVLVLDDLHAIDSQSIAEAIAFLVEHAPPTFHIILCTRVDPPFPLSRLRVGGRMLELRARDLRFTTDETRALFREALAIGLTDEQLARLEERTEGWAAGLQMAALSVRDRSDVDAFIDAFAGTDRYVLDYLMEEVLNRQPQELKLVMLQLSILDRFNAPLVEEVTGSDRGAALLEQLERGNLFLLPLDDAREWFRYHHLFGDLLQHHLRRLLGDGVRELHLRAGRWFRQHGMLAEAMQQVHDAGDPSLMAELVERHWSEILRMTESESLMTAEKFSRIPSDAVASSPPVSVVFAAALLEEQRYDAAEHVLDSSAGGLSKLESCADSHDLRAYAAYFHGRIALYHGDPDAAIGHLERALQEIDLRAAFRSEDLRGLKRPQVLAQRGLAQSRTGDYDAAVAAWEEVLADARRTGNMTLAISMLHNLSLFELHCARLARAWSRCEEIFRLKELVDARMKAPNTFRVDVAHAHQKMASVLFDQNRLTDARDRLINALQLYPPGLTYEITPSLNLLVLVEEALGNTEGVEHALTWFESIAFPPNAVAYSAAVRTLRAGVDLRAGRLDSVGLWAGAFFGSERDRLPQRTYLMSVSEALVDAGYLSAIGRAEDALERVRTLKVDLHGRGLVRREIDALVLEALIERRRGRHAEAIVAIGEALRYAAAEKIARPFVAEGLEMQRLLAEWRTQRTSHEPDVVQFVSRLERTLQPTTTRIAPASAGDVEALTSREMDILRLMSAGYSNQKIAAKLYLSVNTIKTHASNLFSKLGVRNRVEAIEQARKEKLLD